MSIGVDVPMKQSAIGASTQVAEQMLSLHGQLDVLAETVSQLRDRLQAVLRIEPEESSDDAPKALDPPLVEVAAQIRMANKRISEQIYQLSSITSRLEV